MPLHPAAFVLSCQATLKGAQESSHICARRSFLYSALAAALLPRSALAAESASASGGPRVWADDELCKVCKGCGRVPCTLCGGEGVYVTDDGHVVERRETCPGCRGEKTVGEWRFARVFHHQQSLYFFDERGVCRLE